ncbi:hypothetical protein M409DRAFT_55155 [Zasmidium cellare ATCC 36951]|uniref:VOC domain-containing protein n=1 Tax=Zasmidium cellare ATCC 36951 TaxID=1080233 RepID=A0A6A6CGX7_ZASCE|nr:uncharacterized protein M409DRAFT_55155 [Zasmidium cellare ATCC 36951]KAF2166311.1 hypothetical protein M409DRAFT_55155 [Zasmidium cellare ATCC 36951]
MPALETCSKNLRPIESTLQPRGLNHHAYATLDMDKTHQFWTHVMGCNFLGAYSFLDEAGHDKPIPDKYIHALYGMADGSALAFFELQNGYIKSDDGIPKYTKHLALSCDSLEQVTAWKAHWEACGMEVLGEIDHEGIWQSVYTTDPSGVIIEMTFQSHRFDENDHVEGLEVLKAWRRQKDQYLESKDVV